MLDFSTGSTSCGTPNVRIQARMDPTNFLLFDVYLLRLWIVEAVFVCRYRLRMGRRIRPTGL